MRYRPEIEGPHNETLFKNGRGNNIHDRVIVASSKYRIGMGNNGRFLVPYRDLRDRGWHKAFWVIDAALKYSIVVDGGNGEA